MSEITAPHMSGPPRGWRVETQRRRDGAVVLSPLYKTREHAIENAVGRAMAGHTVPIGVGAKW